MLLQAIEITKCYTAAASPVAALHETSFQIAEGEFVAIVGPSGSGKSTLMNLIGLLDRPSSGELLLSGQRLIGLSSDRLAQIRNQRIGFVFQSYHLLARHTVLENVELPLLYSGVRKPERDRLARDVLQAVGLSHRVKHFPAQLSGGEQQRVAIARAIVSDPPLILADEPTGALDTETGRSILALFQELNRDGRTVIMVTHDLDVARHARRLLSIRDGAIVSDASIGETSDARRKLKIVGSPSS